MIAAVKNKNLKCAFLKRLTISSCSNAIFGNNFWNFDKYKSELKKIAEAKGKDC